MDIKRINATGAVTFWQITTRSIHGPIQVFKFKTFTHEGHILPEEFNMATFTKFLVLATAVVYRASLTNAAPSSRGTVVWTVIQPNTTTPTEPVTPFQVFLSHRRVPSKSLAWLMNVMLEQRGIRAYLDVEDLGGGQYRPQIISGLDQSPNFVSILSKTTLDRCIGDTAFADMVHQEIREGVTQNKNLVVVYDEYDYPPVSQFSSVIQTLLATPNKVVWDHASPVDSLNKVISKLVLPSTAG